jgi:hypothetical protein
MPRPSAPNDDAALRWDEFDDASHVESDAAIAALAAAEAGDDDEAGTASATDGAPDAATEPAAPQNSTAGLRLLTALFAVVYLAWSVGWIIGIGLVPLSGPTVLLEVLYQFSEFLAIIASALWFAAVVALTRDGRAVHRIGWLALGTLVLVPWPVVLGVLA